MTTSHPQVLDSCTPESMRKPLKRGGVSVLGIQTMNRVDMCRVSLHAALHESRARLEAGLSPVLFVTAGRELELSIREAHEWLDEKSLGVKEGELRQIHLSDISQLYAYDETEGEFLLKPMFRDVELYVYAANTAFERSTDIFHLHKAFYHAEDAGQNIRMFISLSSLGTNPVVLSPVVWRSLWLVPFNA